MPKLILFDESVDLSKKIKKLKTETFFKVAAENKMAF
jgi:hypothetical protein